MEIKGIDISRWQKQPDFDEVAKDEHAKFIIIKAGGSDKGFYKDGQFERNYAEAKAHGIPVGCYYFVGKNFLTETDGTADATRFCKLIQGKTFEYPVCLDLEAPGTGRKTEVTRASIAFLRELEENGYYAMIYSSDVSGFKDRLNLADLKPFDKWCARYGKAPVNVPEKGIWQYSSKGTIRGINGYVDLDIAYKNYPAIIKKAHLNGF